MTDTKKGNTNSKKDPTLPGPQQQKELLTGAIAQFKQQRYQHIVQAIGTEAQLGLPHVKGNEAALKKKQDAVRQNNEAAISFKASIEALQKELDELEKEHPDLTKGAEGE